MTAQHLIDIDQDFDTAFHLGYARDLFRIQLGAEGRGLFDVFAFDVQHLELRIDYDHDHHDADVLVIDPLFYLLC